MGGFVGAGVLPDYHCLAWPLFKVDSLSPGFGDHRDAEDFSLGVQSENRGTASCSRDTRKETQISALDLKS